MENNAARASRTVTIRDEPIELSRFLKLAGIAESGGEAKHLVAEGLVFVNGEAELRKGRKLRAGDSVVCAGETLLVAIS